PPFATHVLARREVELHVPGGRRAHAAFDSLPPRLHCYRDHRERRPAAGGKIDRRHLLMISSRSDRARGSLLLARALIACVRRFGSVPVLAMSTSLSIASDSRRF